MKWDNHRIPGDDHDACDDYDDNIPDYFCEIFIIHLVCKYRIVYIWHWPIYYFSFQFFILKEVKRGRPEFHEFEVEGTTYSPIGKM